MATFHLRDRAWRPPRLRSPSRTEPRQGASMAVLRDWAMSTALCVGVSAFLQAAVVPWILAAMLQSVALGGQGRSQRRQQGEATP